MSNKPLNILLIKPYIVTDEIQPPLGLGYLATAIRDKHRVEILDGIKEKLSMQDFKNKIQDKNYDIIGIQCYTLDKLLVKDMIKEIRKIKPNVVTLVGGPEPSANPYGIYDYLQADFGFKGEAEIGLPVLLDYIAGDNIELKNIPGLIWQNQNETKVNLQKFIDNLDDLKHPSWDLLKPNTYPQAPHGAFFKKMPTAPVFATRGCPYQCTFCSGWLVSGRKIRYRSVNNLINEIEMLHKKYGINEIHIEDDNFTLRRQFVMDFCHELLTRKLDVAWACPNGVRLDSLDEELVKLMKKSGLYVISLGIESGSDRILKNMKKNLTKEKIRQKVNMLNKIKLNLVGFFILGYPGETINDINQSIDFACELPLKRVSFMTFKPFPGTEASKIVEQELNYKEFNWQDFALNKVAYAPQGISHTELKHLRQKALIKFYLRPRIMYNFFKSIKSLPHAKYIFQRTFRWLFK